MSGLVILMAAYVVSPTKIGLNLSDRMALDVNLEGFVNDCKEGDNSRVPNVIHYIWFGCTREFLPYHYLSVISAIAVQNACLVFFHTNCEPPQDNELFQHLKQAIKKIN